jgi:DNA-binding winged helix-turn-helix (wHTH) protein/predicted ATPase/tetratricopeptide (TPR) repeat protein
VRYDRGSMSTIRWGVFELDPGRRVFLRAGVPVELQPRAFDVLLALARALDQAVSRATLLAVAWPGTNVVDNALTQVIRKVRAALGDDPDEPVWLLSVPRFGYRLRGAPPVERTPASDGFVGRELERQRLAAEGPGLVAVVGAGGVGKTRLVAEALRGRPVLWVDLAAAESVDTVVAYVAHALGVQGADAVGPALAARAEVVVLDTCDRVAAELAGLVSTWSSEAPHTRFVATSRAPVGGARTLSLGPLSATDAGALLTLRCGRALAGEPGLDEVLEAADGLPLALEILGARARHLALGDLVRRLAGRRATVEDPRPDRPARHRSLGASIEASLALAPPAARGLLASLAVFEASFRPNDADEVVGDGAGWELSTLADLGLVVFDAASGSHRLLHAVRDWALAEPRPVGLEERHARWVGRVRDLPAADRLRELAAAASRVVPDRAVRLALADHLEQLKPHFGVYLRLDAVARRLADQATDPEERAEHLTAVLFLEPGGDAGTAAAAAELRSLADTTGSVAIRTAARWAEGRLHLTAHRPAEALAAVEWILRDAPPSTMRLPALGIAVDALRALGRHDEAVARARERVTEARARSPEAEAFALVHLARLGRALGARAEVKGQLQSAINLFRASELRYRLIDPLNLLGVHAYDEGDLAGAEAHWRDALALAIELGDRWNRGHLELNLAALALAERDLDTADRMLRTALQSSAAVKDRVNQARTLSAMASVFRARGAPAEGLPLCDQALELAQGVVAPTGVALAERAACALALGRLDDARRDLLALPAPPVWLELQAGFLWAELLHREGDAAAARARFEATCAAAERAGVPVRGASLMQQHDAARERLGLTG